MSCQSVSACFRAGSTARKTCFDRNLNSRHLLGVTPQGPEVVSPGGKGASVHNQLFGEQGREQLPVQPGFRALVATLRQMSELHDRLEPLEN